MHHILTNEIVGRDKDHRNNDLVLECGERSVNENIQKIREVSPFLSTFYMLKASFSMAEAISVPILYLCSL